MEATKKQQKLSDIIDQKLAELDLPNEPALLYDPVRYTLSLEGKRVRPYLALMGCGLCKGEIEEALPAALSIELLHNFTLLHDDIMDAADTRRGALSVYKKWNAATAILSGDAMYARAFRELRYYGSHEEYSKEQYVRILDIFLDSAEKVCEGQAFDLEFESRYDVTIDEYLEMIEGKTAALISGALALGGAVAGVEEAEIRELTFVGDEIGIAFQIQDDLLDVIADPDKFGKQKGGDIIEGKKTYLTLLALERCNESQQHFLLNVLKNQTTSQHQIDEVINLYRSLNVIADTQHAVQQHYEAAMEHLQAFPSSDFKEELIEFLNRLISREY